MPLQLDEEDHPPVCSITTWTIQDGETLTDVLAWLYLRKLEHAARVIADLDPGRAFTPAALIENAISVLSVRTDDIEADLRSDDPALRSSAEAKRDTRAEHRDGLLFQHLSWVAAHLRFPGAHACPPHIRQADKGFDGLLIEVNTAQTALSRVVLSEDKASTSPRGLVTGSIWPEIKHIQANGKDREILAAVTTILDTMDLADKEGVLEATEWRRTRQFRVSLAAGEDQRKNGDYKHLFAGFDDAAGGEIGARMGEVMPLSAVRADLQDLASRVVDNLRERLARV